MNNKIMKQQMTSSGGGGGERKKVNSSSNLLSNSENETVFSLLGRKCQSLSTAVVQIYKTEGSAHSHWKKKHTGVVCFVKDASFRSYYFRAYCLIKNELIWEHEVYDSLQLTKARPYLLTFEGQDGHVGLNFVSEDECQNFFRIVENVIETRNRKRQERRQKSRISAAPPMVPNTKDPKLQLQNATTADNSLQSDSSRVQLRNHSKINSVQLTQPKQTFLPAGFSILPNKVKKPKYTKADISTPTNFVHVSHVGWDANKGFDLTGNEEDEILTNFLNKAGVSENHMNDRDTRDFIYEFIQSNNVLASVKSENVEKPRPPAPAPPPVPSRHQNHQNGLAQRSAPPQPPARQPPPPVPTSIPGSKVPPPPSRVQPTVTAPAAPPPPPPPPPPTAVAAPPPPPMPVANDAVTPTSNTLKPPAPALPVVNDTRSALMDSIRKGTTLKKIDTSTLSTGSGDSRNDLLSEIRSGIELRPVESRELAPISNRKSDDSCTTDALADALRRALQERGRVLQSSDDDSDGSSENDGEWDD